MGNGKGPACVGWSCHKVLAWLFRGPLTNLILCADCLLLCTHTYTQVANFDMVAAAAASDQQLLPQQQQQQQQVQQKKQAQQQLANMEAAQPQFWAALLKDHKPPPQPDTDTTNAAAAAGVSTAAAAAGGDGTAAAGAAQAGSNRRRRAAAAVNVSYLEDLEDWLSSSGSDSSSDSEGGGGSGFRRVGSGKGGHRDHKGKGRRRKRAARDDDDVWEVPPEQVGWRLVVVNLSICFVCSHTFAFVCLRFAASPTASLSHCSHSCALLPLHYTPLLPTTPHPSLHLSLTRSFKRRRTLRRSWMMLTEILTLLWRQQ